MHPIQANTTGAAGILLTILTFCVKNVMPALALVAAVAGIIVSICAIRYYIEATRNQKAQICDRCVAGNPPPVCPYGRKNPYCKRKNLD